MASDHETFHHNPTHTHLTTIFRCPIRRKILTRRRRLQSVRLGGKKPRRGLLLVRIFRRLRLRWLKLQYTRMLKKLKQYYSSLVKDLIEAGATLESYQQRVLMETSFAVPVMGVSFSSFPSAAGFNGPRSIMM